MRNYLAIFLFWVCVSLNAQNYTSFFTGDTSNVEVETQPGLVLMGGSTENDSAMVWWLKKSGGGDVLVIRASGSNGYNSYLYSELGIPVNSVETIVFNNRNASFDPYVQKRLREADALWIAGGDQARYENFWKNSPVDSLINWLIREKNIPVGGTSAGMAILGQYYFSAQNGSITSAQALANPFSPLMTIGRFDFIKAPFMKNIITDTHFDNPDRRGRLLAFLARLYQDSGRSFRGIAAEERTAVCVEADGMARVFGNNPNEDFAYFVQVNCENDSLPERCLPGQTLSWNRGGKALKVCRIPGTNQGNRRFDLSSWEIQMGGEWFNWSALNGIFSSNPSTAPNCLLSSAASQNPLPIIFITNPRGTISCNTPLAELQVVNGLGQRIGLQKNSDQEWKSTFLLPESGVYFVRYRDFGGRYGTATIWWGGPAQNY